MADSNPYDWRGGGYVAEYPWTPTPDNDPRVVRPFDPRAIDRQDDQVSQPPPPPPVYPRDLPPAPIPARPEGLAPGGVADLPATRIPIPWFGPEHFFDPDTGTTFRMGHGGRVRITGHLADWDPVDQWAAVLLSRGKGVPRDAGVSLGTKANANPGQAPGQQLTMPHPTPEQVAQAIQTGQQGVRFGPYAYSGLASTMPKIGPIIAGTIGNAFFPGLGIVTAATDSMVQQAITRGNVNWKEVGGQAVGGAAGALGGALGSAAGSAAGSAVAGPAVGAATGAVVGSATGAAASNAAQQAYYNGELNWGQVGRSAAIGAGTGAVRAGTGAGPVTGAAINTAGSVLATETDPNRRRRNPYR